MTSSRQPMTRRSPRTIILRTVHPLQCSSVVALLIAWPLVVNAQPAQPSASQAPAVQPPVAQAPTQQPAATPPPAAPVATAPVGTPSVDATSAQPAATATTSQPAIVPQAQPAVEPEPAAIPTTPLNTGGVGGTAADPAGMPSSDAVHPAEVSAAAPESATNEPAPAEVTEEPAFDLDALLGNAGSEATMMAALDEYKLSIYGFADFAYTKSLSGDFSFGRGFAVGNLNVYLDAELGDGWRALSEVRFTYLPHGAYALTTETLTEAPTPINTTVGDYADYARPMRVGGIEIERAWLEYSFNQWLTIRGGSWLTPYGIWNVDHGSPVILGTVRPFIVGEEFFPERQTGLKFFGGTQVGPTELGYAFTLSNGRGPYDTHLDLDDNLGVGGRLFARHDSDYGVVSVGASAYTGRFTDSVTTYDPITFLPVDDVRYQFDETSIGVDLKYEYGEFLFQAEAISNGWAWTDEGRPVSFVFDGTAPGFEPDARRWGAYGLTGYRTPWLNTMPWVGAEIYDSGTIWKGRSAALFFGLNLRPTPRVVLKAQLTHSWFYDTQSFSDGGNALVTQAAWSF